MTNTKVDLETIAREGTSFLMNKQADEEPDMTKKNSYWMNYAIQKLGEDAANELYEMVKTDPIKMGQSINANLIDHQKQLVDEVRKNPQSVIKGINQDYAIDMAAPYLVDDNYKALKNAIENNGDVKGLYASLHDNNLWRSVVAIASHEDVKRVATLRINDMLQRNITENLFDENGYNASKTAEFLYEQASEMEEKEQNSFYTNIGLAYTQSQMQAQAESQKTKK